MSHRKERPKKKRACLSVIRLRSTVAWVAVDWVGGAESTVIFLFFSSFSMGFGNGDLVSDHFHI